MPPKVIRCELCGVETSKRQSLSLDSLRIGKGRACRSHDEVLAASEKLEQIRRERVSREKEEEMMRSVGRTMRIITLVSGVRMLSAWHGIPQETLLARVAWTQPRDIYEEVFAEVQRQGPVTSDEMTTAILTALEWKKRMGI